MRMICVDRPTASPNGGRNAVLDLDRRFDLRLGHVEFICEVARVERQGHETFRSSNAVL